MCCGVLRCDITPTSVGNAAATVWENDMEELKNRKVLFLFYGPHHVIHMIESYLDVHVNHTVKRDEFFAYVHDVDRGATGAKARRGLVPFLPDDNSLGYVLIAYNDSVKPVQVIDRRVA